jgi:sugar/nucleoside kinase (ribokinase family)
VSETPLLAPHGPNRPFDFVGLGQSAIDHVCQVDGLPRFAGKARVIDYSRLPGGQVATAVLCCARLGLRCALIGSTGDDEAGDAVLAPLREAGVDLGAVRRVAGAPTQLGVILVDRRSGERTVLWYRDPRLSLDVSALDRAAVTGGRVLHLDGGDPDVSTWAAQTARESGIPVVLDLDTPAPGVDRLLAAVDFPIVSRDFAENYFGTHKVREALRGLAGLGGRLAVVTLGEIGAIAQLGERVIESPAFRVGVRDTTGAGDVFHAAFAWGLLEGLGPEGVLRAANAAAAMNCRALGAQGGLPSRSELLAFVAESQPAAWREP